MTGSLKGEWLEVKFKIMLKDFLGKWKDKYIICCRWDLLEMLLWWSSLRSKVYLKQSSNFYSNIPKIFSSSNYRQQHWVNTILWTRYHQKYFFEQEFNVASLVENFQPFHIPRPTTVLVYERKFLFDQKKSSLIQFWRTKNRQTVKNIRTVQL